MQPVAGLHAVGFGKRVDVRAQALSDAIERVATTDHADVGAHATMMPAAQAYRRIDQHGGACRFFRQHHVRRHAQIGIDDRAIVGAEVVELADHVRFGIESRGDARNRVAVLDRVVLHAHALFGSELRQFLLEAFGGVDRHQQPVRAGWIGGEAMERRIERVKVSALMPAMSATTCRSIWPPV